MIAKHVNMSDGREVETSIEYLSSSDEQNRCRFFLNWQYNGRPKSQVFFADPHTYGHKRPEEQ
jgi:hypothetical protein